MKTSLQRFTYFTAGTIFSILWASASVAAKIGLRSGQPFVLFVVRFAIAAALMLFISHAIMRQPLPTGKRLWKQLIIYGLLNVGLYLGLFVLAMREVSAGLGTLFIATNPVFIVIISAVWGRQRIRAVTLVSFALCLAGLLLAAYPLLLDSYASLRGIGLLLLSMLTYSLGAIYFSRHEWGDLHILTINGWQTLFGGLSLLPFALWFFDASANRPDANFIGSILWLAGPVSIVAVLLWLYLLRDNPVNASAWLFLCPIIGFAIAALIVDEPLSWHTAVGVVLVLAGLLLVQRKKPS